MRSIYKARRLCLAKIQVSFSATPRILKMDISWCEWTGWGGRMQWHAQINVSRDLLSDDPINYRCASSIHHWALHYVFWKWKATHLGWGSGVGRIHCRVQIDASQNLLQHDPIRYAPIPDDMHANGFAYELPAMRTVDVDAFCSWSACSMRNFCNASA